MPTELKRTFIEGITCVLLSKGMVLAFQSNEIAWMIAFAIGAFFWMIRVERP